MQELNEDNPNLTNEVQKLPALKTKFPPHTLLLPDSLTLPAILETLFEPKSSNLPDLTKKIGNSLRVLTNLAGKEIGGHITDQEGIYFVASLNLGSENAASRQVSDHPPYTYR